MTSSLECATPCEMSTSFIETSIAKKQKKTNQKNDLLQSYFSGQKFILSDNKQVSQRKSPSNKRSNPIQSETLEGEEMWVMI